MKKNQFLFLLFMGFIHLFSCRSEKEPESGQLDLNALLQPVPAKARFINDSLLSGAGAWFIRKRTGNIICIIRAGLKSWGCRRG
jgi:hypothetical protein